MHINDPKKQQIDSTSESPSDTVYKSIYFMNMSCNSNRIQSELLCFLLLFPFKIKLHIWFLLLANPAEQLTLLNFILDSLLIRRAYKDMVNVNYE